MKWRWWKTAQELSQTFALSRQRQSDKQFLDECNLANDEFAKQVALSVRYSVAAYGMIDAQYIYANDRYPDTLGKLSGWDSIDLLGWIIELEADLGR